MKIRNTFIIISMVFLVLNLNAIEFNTYDMEIEHVFKASLLGEDDVNNLAVDLYSMGGEVSRGPSLFFLENDLIVHDEAGKYRTVLLDTDYSFKETYDYCIYNSTFYNFNNTILGMNSYNGIKIVENKEIISDISFTNLSFLRNNKDLYYQDNTLFIFDKDNNLWGIKNPGLDNDENRKNIVKEEEIIKEITEGKYKGLTIDSKKRLFLDGELQTINIITYFDYLKDKTNTDLPILNKKNKENFYISNNTVFIAKDNKGFSYWYKNNRILIVSDKNIPVIDYLITKEFRLDTYPAVSPEGDIYFMKYNEDNVTLYKIARKW